MRYWPGIAAIAAFATLCAGVLVWRGGGERPVWQEIAWPYPRDAWPAGRVFRCDPARCGGAVDVAIRPKLGFCGNCDSGVTADEEVDRVSDLDLLSSRFTPDAPGYAVRVGGMAGRARDYTVSLPDGGQLAVTGVATSRKCDLVIVTAVGAAVRGTAARQAMQALMASPSVASWLGGVLGSG